MSREPGPGSNVIHWFRKDLRLHDNPALREALCGCRTFYGIYIIDPIGMKDAKVSANRCKFLIECLADLDNSLRACGSRLYLLRGQLTDLLPKLFKEWSINKLTFEVEIEPFGQQRDLAVSLIAEDHDVEVVSRTSHTLYDLNRILAANNGQVPMLFKEFELVLRKLGPPDKPVDPVDKKMFSSSVCPVSSDHDARFNIPTIVELNQKGQTPSGSSFKGGESEAVKRLVELEEKVKMLKALCRT